MAPAAAPPASKKFAWIRLLVLLALAGGGAFAAYRLFVKPQPQAGAPQAAVVRTVRVTKGPIQKVLRMTGSTSAKNYAAIAAPRMRAAEGGRGLVLIYLARSGAIVKKGDVVAQIDTQAMKERLDDLEAQIQSADADIKKRKAEIGMNWENLQQTLRAAKAELDKVKLDSSAGEIRTPIDAEQLKLSVEEAEATYKEQSADLGSKKISDTADLRVLELTKELTIRQRDRYKSDIEKFTIEAPMGGLAVMQSLVRGAELAQVQQGDQVAPGQPFMKIVDVNGMQVQASASQVESEELHLGQPATITFDAFPQLKLNAKVSNIGAIAVAGATANRFLRTIPVYLRILDHDNRVIPDLTTSTDVVVDQAANALLIPRAALESSDGKWFVHVKSGLQYQRREVKLGIRDNVRVAILDGVREGEEIALDRPSASLLVALN